MLRTEGSQERLDNLAELKRAIYEFETTSGEEVTLEDYLSHVALLTNQDLTEKNDLVKMMTIHTSKGLEFPYVFICAMSEGIFPSSKANTKESMEEERRLSFVAYTRAKEGLFLSDSDGTSFGGNNRYPSRFIIDTGSICVTWTGSINDKLINEANSHIALSEKVLSSRNGKTQFSIGDRVGHFIFGDGTVTDIDTDKGTYTIMFDKIKTERYISFTAKLIRIDE